MSGYAGSQFLHDLAVDPQLRELARVAPDRALARYDLTDRERELFLAGEVGELYLRGVNDFLLHNAQRFGLFGLDMPLFSERMRAVAARSSSSASAASPVEGAADR